MPAAVGGDFLDTHPGGGRMALSIQPPTVTRPTATTAKITNWPRRCARFSFSAGAPTGGGAPPLEDA
jgi:hypothetical protein